MLSCVVLCLNLFIYMFVTQVPVYTFVHTPNNIVLLCNSGDPQSCTPKVRLYLCLWEAMYNMFASGGQFTTYVLSIWNLNTLITYIYIVIIIIRVHHVRKYR